MWETVEIEKYVETRLKKNLKARGDELYAHYLEARSKVATDILPFIIRAEPDLTDHGVDHIRNVLENVFALLTNQEKPIASGKAPISRLKEHELYCLLMAVLFHDVGNFFGRKDHQLKVGPILTAIRGGQLKYPQESSIISNLVKAHTGTSRRTGTKDMLSEIPKGDQFEGKPIRCRELASILRFADELAEGHQRTSAFVQSVHGYKESSMIFHEYANICSIAIDPENERILCTYNIDVDLSDKTNGSFKKFSELLNYVYERVLKLDQERKYCKHESEMLDRFKCTSVKLNFHIDHDVTDCDLPPLVLTDKVVPGEQSPSVAGRHPEFSPEEIWQQLAQ